MAEYHSVDIQGISRSFWDKIREKLRNMGSRLFHRGWVETDAEVCECTLPNYKTLQTVDDGFPSPLLNGYVVTFTYVVNGEAYEGMTNSPDEVLKHDQFKIRYNPSHPEQNSTFDSKTNWVIGYSKYLHIFLAALLLLALIGHFFFRW